MMPDPKNGSQSGEVSFTHSISIWIENVKVAWCVCVKFYWIKYLAHTQATFSFDFSLPHLVQ